MSFTRSLYQFIASIPFHKAIAAIIAIIFFSYIFNASLNPLSQPLVIHNLPSIYASQSGTCPINYQLTGSSICSPTLAATWNGQIVPILELAGLALFVIFILAVVDLLHLKKLKFIQYLIIFLLIFIIVFAFSLITPISFILFNPPASFIALFLIVYIVAWLIDF